MTLELTIQKMFNKYPTLFKERADCLNHLFCTIGNGYEWKKGELVGCGSICRAPDKFDKEELDLLQNQLIDGKAFQYNKLSLRDEVSQMVERERNREDFDEYLKRHHWTKEQWLEMVTKEIENTPSDIYHKCPRNMRWYFYLGGYCKEYAYLWNYPKNIKRDWLEGINETKSLLIEDGYSFEEEIDTEKNRKEYIKYL